MIEAVYKKKGIRICQAWFAEDENGVSEKSDIIFYHGIPHENSGSNSFSTPFHTLMTDLTKTGEELNAAINKNVRYEIRRNNKEAVTYRVFSSKELLQKSAIVKEFTDLYELMYREKGKKQTIYMPQLKAYMEKDAFFLTGIFDGDKPLVFHSYIIEDEKVRLLHSVSDFRSESADANLVARANKRLHWEDICMFKEQGKHFYDWGGVSSLTDPNGIDAFKFKFGGEPLTYYNVYKGSSLLGKLAIALLKMKNGMK